MGELDQELVLHIGDLVAMGQQQRAPRRGQQREHQRGPGRAQPARAHAPLEHGEHDDEQHENTVLQHLDVAQRLPHADVTHRPNFRVGADQEEPGQPQHRQRPMPRPAHARLVQQRQAADQQHEQPGPVMIVFAPSDVGRVARRQLAGTRDGGRRGLAGARRRFGVKLGLQRRQRQRIVVGRSQPRPNRRVARRHFGPCRPVLRQVHAGGNGGERGGGKEDRDADAHLHFGEPLQPQHGGARISPQPLDGEEIAQAEQQQGAEHGNLGRHHHAISSAIHRIPGADIGQAHHAARQQDAAHTKHRHAGKARADPAPGRAFMHMAKRQQEARDAADPDRGAKLVQRLHRQQQPAAVEPGRGMGGQRGRRKFDAAERQQQRRRRGAPQQQAQRQQPRRGAFHQPGDGEVGLQHIAQRQLDRADQHAALQGDGQALAQHQRQRRPACDACGPAGDAGAAGQLGGKRAGQQQEEQGAPQRHRLAEDYQAMEDDLQVAEKVDKQGHSR